MKGLQKGIREAEGFLTEKAGQGWEAKGEETFPRGGGSAGAVDIVP